MFVYKANLNANFHAGGAQNIILISIYIYILAMYYLVFSNLAEY